MQKVGIPHHGRKVCKLTQPLNICQQKAHLLHITKMETQSPFRNAAIHILIKINKSQIIQQLKFVINGRILEIKVQNIQDSAEDHTYVGT